MKEGDEITADLAPGRRSLSRAVRLLSLLPSPGLWSSGRAAAQSAVAAALAGPPLPGAPGAVPGSAAARAGLSRTAAAVAVEPPSRPVRVYTDYPLLAERLTDPAFELAAEPAGIDALWLIQPLQDFRCSLHAAERTRCCRGTLMQPASLKWTCKYLLPRIPTPPPPLSLPRSLPEGLFLNQFPFEGCLVQKVRPPVCPPACR